MVVVVHENCPSHHVTQSASCRRLIPGHVDAAIPAVTVRRQQHLQDTEVAQYHRHTDQQGHLLHVLLVDGLEC